MIAVLVEVLVLDAVMGSRCHADLFRPPVVGISIGMLAVAVVHDCHVAHVSGWRAVAMAVTPAMRMRCADDDGRAITDGVVTVEVGVVITAAVVIVITVAVWIVTPPRITGTDEQRSGEIAAAVAI